MNSIKNMSDEIKFLNKFLPADNNKLKYPNINKI